MYIISPFIHIPGHVFEINLISKTPVISRRVERFPKIQQIYLKHKINDLKRKGFIEPSTSSFRNPIILVAYPERTNAFIKKHGDKAYEEMEKEENAEEVCAFFRFCMDLRLLLT